MARFTIIPGLLRVVTDRGIMGCWYVKFIIGAGAGRCWRGGRNWRGIGGYTAYVAWKCGLAGARVPKLAIGVTGNANVIPYTSH